MAISIAKNPFKGLCSYDGEDKENFRGRGNEISELCGYVEKSPVSVVMGESGIGKTSLLQAGLIPKFEQENFLPIFIRLDYKPGAPSLVNQVKERVKEEADNHNIDIIENDRGHGEETLWEYFRFCDFVDVEEAKRTPVLILDQFEELFTLGRFHEDRETLREELYCLIEDQVPRAVQERFLRDGEEIPYINSPVNVRIVISLRENYLPHMEWLKRRIPSIDRAVFRILPMGGKQAREVMAVDGGIKEGKLREKILKQFYPENTEVRVTISDDILEVVPALLSLLCTQVIEKELEDLSEKDKDKIIADFYEDEIRKLPQRDKLSEFIEDKLLTEGGYRTPFYLSFDFELRDAVEEAINRRILRRYYIDEKEHVEIIHDLLVPVIKEKRTIRDEEKREKEYKEKKRRLFYKMVAIAGLISVFFAALAVRQYWVANERYIEAQGNRLAAESSLVLKEDEQKAIRVAQAGYKIRDKVPIPSTVRSLCATAFSFEKSFLPSIQFKNESYVSKFIPLSNSKKILIAGQDGIIHLGDQSGQLLQSFRGHSGTINSLALSSNQDRFVSASDDKTVRLWNLSAETLAIYHHEKSVSNALFSKDERFIVTLSGGDQLSIFDVEGQLIKRKVLEEKIWDIKFSPLGSCFIARMRNKEKVFSNEGDLISALPHDILVSGAIFSPGGDRVVTSSWDKTACIWDLQGNKKAVMEHDDYVNSVSYSHNGEEIVTASIDGTARVWDKEGDFLRVLRHTDGVQEACFSPDDKYIVTRGRQMATLWDRKGDKIADLAHDDEVKEIIFSGKGDRFLTRAVRSVKVWNLKGSLIATLKSPPGVVGGAEFSPNGKKVLSYSRDMFFLWDLEDNFVMDVHSYIGKIDGGEIFKGGKGIVTWDYKDVSILNLETQTSTDFRNTSFVVDLSVSEQVNKIVVLSGDNEFSVYDLQGNSLFTKNLPDQMSSMRFVPKGDKILTVAENGRIALWDLDGNILRENLLGDNAGDIEGAAMSMREDMLATWNGNVATIWKRNGKKLADIRHNERVNGAVFSPDGKRVLTYSMDHTAKLWDLEGNLLANLDRHTDEVLGASFSKNGKMMYTISRDGTVKRWYGPEAIMEWLETAPIPELTQEEKKELGIDKLDLD